MAGQGEVECFGPIMGLADNLVAEVLQQVGHVQGDEGVVLHHEDPHIGVSRGRTRPRRDVRYDGSPARLSKG